RLDARLDVVGVEARQLRDVVDGTDVASREALVLPALRVERIGPAALDAGHEALVLQCAETLRRPAIHRALEHVGHRVVTAVRVPVERVAVERDRAHGRYFWNVAPVSCITSFNRRTAYRPHAWPA